MNPSNWQVLGEVSGSGLGEMLQGLLEANHIQVILSQEGAGHSVFPVTVGRFGRVQILVPSENLAEAQKILSDFYAGRISPPEEPPLTNT